MGKIGSLIKTVIKYLPVIIAAWVAWQQVHKVTATPDAAVLPPAG